jgi:hypothetical protein
MLLTIGIGLQLYFACIAVSNLIFIEVAGFQIGYEQFPYASSMNAHRMAAPIPSIEITDHTDTFGIGCPNPEENAGYASHFKVVRT